jgi:PPE-repeat protein
MDFAALPPEINSGRIYAGAGSGPMLAAAAAWHQLATELHSTASSYQSVLSGLIAGPWLGPSSASMAAASATTAAWMNATAAAAEQTATQAQLAATAYETAFAETVPPPVIAANRSLLATLIATNLLGQNTGAIAATEAEYAEIWAQDAAAMYGYAAASASATTLTPFTQPPQNTDPNGLTNQAAAVGQSAGTSAGKAQAAVSSVQQTFSAVPDALTGLASPAAALPALTPLQTLDLLADLSGIFIDPELSASGLGVDSAAGFTALPYDIGGFYTGLHTDDIVSGWAGLEPWPGVGASPPTQFPVVTNLAGGTVSAGLGQANTVGSLSVPPAWATPAAVKPAALALPTSAAGAPAAALETATGSVVGDAALGSLAARSLGTPMGTGRRERAKAGGEGESTLERGGVVKGIAAELRELAELREQGVLTNEEFLDLKKRLLGR